MASCSSLFSLSFLLCFALSLSLLQSIYVDQFKSYSMKKLMLLKLSMLMDSHMPSCSINRIVEFTVYFGTYCIQNWLKQSAIFGSYMLSIKMIMM